MSRKSDKPHKRAATTAMAPLLPKNPDGHYIESISAQQEQLVGQAIIVWSRLESVIEEVIWRILKLEIHEGRIITSRLDAKHKMELFRLHLVDESKVIFDAISPQLDDHYSFRNKCAHGKWVTVLPSNQAASISLRDKLPNEGVEPSDAIATILPPPLMIGHIENMHVSIRNLIRLREHISSLTEKPPPQPPPG